MGRKTRKENEGVGQIKEELAKEGEEKRMGECKRGRGREREIAMFDWKEECERDNGETQGDGRRQRY